PFLQDRILAVPQGQREAEALLDVAEAGEPVLTPVIGTRPRLVVREVVPRVAIRAVVFAHRAPLALAEIRPPQPPWRVPLASGGQAGEFGGRPRRRLVVVTHGTWLHRLQDSPIRPEGQGRRRRGDPT